MPNIYLISTSHRARGLCNAEELLKILGAAKPEVIFEELRPEDVDAVYQGQNVEPSAIKLYRNHNSIQQVAVDRFDLSECLKNDTDRLFELVERESPDYLQLKQILEYETAAHGFRYLNSPPCEKLSQKLDEIEDEAISKSGDHNLVRDLGNWRKHNQDRERKMLENIYEYCRANTFNVGVFLVGSAHRAGIKKLLEEFSAKESDSIRWRIASS